MASFTPGPWRYTGERGAIMSADIDGLCVAVCFRCDAEEHNAHLIAAAPELLDACRQLTEFAKRQGWFHVAIEAGETAIAKAEGKEQ